jgi:rhamnosyltransferase
MTAKQSLGTTAIIVTYHPNTSHLDEVIARIFNEVNFILLVDNHSPKISQWKIPQKFKTKIHTLKFPDNLGIAYAQNRGIEWAFKKGSKYILFLDQDSLPSTDMVHKLKEALKTKITNNKSQVLAAGPVVIDFNSKEKTPFLIDKKNKFLKTNANIVIVKTLISSGMLIDKRAFELIGGMRSDYFIDHVDTEWLYRLNKRGYLVVGVKNTFMQHSNGEKIIEVSFFNKKIRFISHLPFRNYYRIRNHFFMLRDLNIHLGVNFYAHNILLAIYFLFFDNNPFLRLKYILLGFWHGLTNKRGKLDMKTMKCIRIPSTKFDLT